MCTLFFFVGPNKGFIKLFYVFSFFSFKIFYISSIFRVTVPSGGRMACSLLRIAQGKLSPANFLLKMLTRLMRTVVKICGKIKISRKILKHAEIITWQFY